jgi:hypothetical protein
MQRRMVVCYRRFGTSYRSHLQGSKECLTLEYETHMFSEASVTKYCPAVRKIPADSTLIYTEADA